MHDAQLEAPLLRNQIPPAAQTDAGVGGNAEAGQREGISARTLIDPLVFGVLQSFLPGRLEELQTLRAAGLVRQLRHRVSIAIVCAVLTAPIAVWLLVRGLATYVVVEGPDCAGPLRIWLLGFLMLQLAWPICMPSLTLLLLGWCLGADILVPPPKNCPRLHSFLVEALILQSLEALLLLAAALAALTARPLIQSLGDLLSSSGTDPEVVQLIRVLPGQSVPADEECVICLSREEEDGVDWRQLCCGHIFHEPCLLEWLKKARKCPVCRLDLHEAYRDARQDTNMSNTAVAV
mmetsp:Transcript_8951/g.16109  ORF Transcript_8951/g.16109 Transcript_8951/m.16109 type:complete len:292 (-) Transcript_8951:15-890(-)